MPEKLGIKFENSTIKSVDFSHRDLVYENLNRESENTDKKIIVVSRKPQKEIIRYLDIKKSDTYWMTELKVKAGLQPRLEKISSLITDNISKGSGIILIEGIEWLKQLHGEDSLLVMVRRINDQINSKNWSVLFLYNKLAFSTQWNLRFQREAPQIVILEENVNDDFVEHENIDYIQPPEKDESTEILEDGSPRLTMLTKLPKSTFTISLLRRRIIQWRKMGLEVSELEPALHKELEEAYSVYLVVEEKVRKVVELENLMENLSNLDASERSIFRFQLRQLTSINEIASKLASKVNG